MAEENSCGGSSDDGEDLKERYQGEIDKADRDLKILRDEVTAF